MKNVSMDRLPLRMPPPSYRLVLLTAVSVLVLVSAVPHTAAGKPAYFRGSDVDVFSEPAMSAAARQIAETYPFVRSELEATLGLRADFRPAVILLADRAVFEQVTGNRLVVAYAVPSKMLVVIDYPLASKDPFSTRAILKHELCHLLLHRHIPSIPRWLDEGVCQWASDGLDELLSNRGGTPLSWHSLGGSLVPLKSLEIHFPQEEQGLVLAYEMSRSVVDFIAARFGRNSIRNILTSLAHGMSVDEAFRVSLGMTLPDLERSWRDSLGTWPRLLTFLVANIYTILFSFAALSTVAGYARYRIRRKRLRDEPEDETTPDDLS